MKTRLIAIAVLCVASIAEAQGQCPQKRIDQESYLALSEGVYAYVGEIAPASGRGEWKPFTVRLLVGMYRRPLLLQEGVMRENDLRKLLSGRSDIKVMTLSVQGNDAKAGQRFAPDKPQTVEDPLRKTRGTVRALKVVPPGKAPGGVILEVCGF